MADAVDVLGDIPFDRITLRHGLEVLEKHRAAGALFELSKRHQVLKKIGEYAERFGYWQKNEWKYLGEDLPQPDKNSHFAAIHYKELPELMRDLRKRNFSYSVLLAILWGLLNVTRASETVSASFEAISEYEGMLIWTVIVNKGGKGRREHQIPLTKQAQKLLSYARQHSRSDYLFPSPMRGGQKAHVNSQTPNDVFKTINGGKYKQLYSPNFGQDTNLLIKQCSLATVSHHGR